MKQIRWIAVLVLLVVLAVPGYWATAQTPNVDLFVEDVEINPPAPKAGETVTVRATIVNDGRDDVNDRFDVYFRIDGSRIAIFRVRLPAGRQERTLEATWEASEGDHVLLIEVDRPRDQIDERNERNNTFEQTILVNPDTSVVSFTRAGLEAQALAWEQTSEALSLNTTSTNLLLLLDLIKEGFSDFSRAMGILTTTLQNQNALWPSAFAADNVFAALIEPYTSLENAAGVINQSLDSFDLTATVSAMGDVDVALRALAAQDSVSLPLEGLEAAADAVKLAIEAAELAQQNFGVNSAATDGAIQTLVGEVRALGEIVAEVAQSLRQSVLDNTAQLANGQGQPLRDFDGGQITISAPSGPVTFELVDRSGGTVVQVASDTNRVSWDGADAQGQPLRPETYFFRVSWSQAQPGDVGVIEVAVD